MIFYGLSISADETIILPIGDEPLIIGRSPASADIIVNHGCVSRQHARLQIEAGKLHVEDLGSRNGMKVNGEATTNSTLVPGDTLNVAHFEFRVVKIDDKWGGTLDRP